MDIAEARRLLGTMWTIRAFEERLAELVAAKQLPGLVHLSIGQEATATGTCAALRPDDALESDVPGDVRRGAAIPGRDAVLRLEARDGIPISE